MQLDKFTLKSQEAIQAAQQLAQNNGNQELQPEHLLKAILEQSDGVVVPVLQKMGVTPSVVLSETNQLIANLPKVSGAGANQTYASQALRTLLDQSFKTAANMQDEYISQEHLFLTMLADRSLKVTALLGRHGITSDAFLKALMTVRGNQRVTDPYPEEKYRPWKNTPATSPMWPARASSTRWSAATRRSDGSSRSCPAAPRTTRC